MFKTQTKKQRGFTLIEMLVVIAIMALMISMAIPFELSYRTRAPIKNTAKQLRSLFWEAQARSLAPRSVNVAYYKIDLVKSFTDGSAFLYECISISSCSAISGAQTPLALFANNIRIYSVTLYNSVGTPILSPTTTVSTFFTVGDSRDAGKISFYNSTGTIIPNATKMKVAITPRTAVTPVYYVIVDGLTNSIIYSTQ
ncbi:MAG: prepilin-type N-terminal cleavage/methylation domain-containing protein [Patescibacteria group bacterium]|nr:prepilin-type N-terminal cleavage/methylation domain-containing protein [Patescibacteria group bacterium]